MRKRKLLSPTAQRAARKRLKQLLGERARRAFSDVFNEVFPLHAEASPHGSGHDFYRWHLQAMRKELEEREAAPEGLCALRLRDRA